MMQPLPNTAAEFMAWDWSEIQPHYQALAERPLSAATVEQWLLEWTRLANLLHERFSRLNTSHNIDTTDETAEAQFNDFLENIFPQVQTAEQELIQKLLDSGLEPAGMELPLRKMRTDAALFREENLPLLTKERQLASQYNKISGAQTISWQGEEITLVQLRALSETPERSTREALWQLAAARQLADREAINHIWQELLELRIKLSRQAGFDNYLDYRWQFLKRYDYTPRDSEIFHEAIASAVVPAANRMYAAYAADLGVETLRPWDVHLDIFPHSLPKMHPFSDIDALESGASRIFHRVDPQLGAYFDVMRREKLLDLPNRKGKSPGAYCTYFPVVKRPFIFMNAVGTGSDVRTMLHESGHAFHGFEAGQLPYAQQQHPGAEFAEVASMSMELLAFPYLTKEEGGLFSEAEAARFRQSQMHRIIAFWPYMAVVDAFQHWVYRNEEAALDPVNCDAKWVELWRRFLPAIDWSGYEDALATGWHRKLHIFRYPFYYVEYGMAQVGAIMVWQNALRDRPAAVAQYRKALALGGTKSLPDLFAEAGAVFKFDEPTMQDIVSVLEQALTE
jgi:oligoendopeptidase F